MIHPTAQIDEGARIADNVQIGPFCRISKDAILKSGVILEPHVTLKGRVTLGEQTHLHAFVEIGNGTAAITTQERCTVREFTKIGTHPNDKQSIHLSSGCYIMGYVEIRSGVKVGSDCIITNSVLLDRYSRCEEKVIVGAKASLAERCSIGRGVMVGGVSAVQSDIPPYCLAEGYPHALIRGLNLVGMRRNFKDRESILEVKKVFMRLKKKDFSSLEAAQLLPETKDKHAQQFVSFVATHSVSNL